MAESLYRPQDPSQVATVLQGLENARGKKNQTGFMSKKNTFSVKGSNIKVDSWKIGEWDYKKPHLPTYARGLFTTTNSQGQPEIAVRGYDKFFNHGEVRDTEWPNVVSTTRGPYELSVKENGCIIFMSGLEDGTLLVCSKHSTGSRDDADISHAEWGAKWVDKHVQSVGKTRRDLAHTLRQMNATAVAELCDDEFEEHVLEYNPDTAGLYLHGINLNLPEFATYPHAQVDKFAVEWGFRKTMFVVKDDINEVKTFLEGVAETGNYDGRDTEGFVIRCQSNAHSGQWHDWFFKYKFEEPYRMYRQWRECTKAVISGKEPHYKKHKEITEEYLDFARRELHGDKELAKQYNHNHGIIKMRDDFLASRGLTGSDIIRDEMQQEAAAGADESSPSKDVMLVPIATIGCGKTTVALALVKLFGWGHIQNDNITVKKNKPQAFARQCVSVLEDKPVMIADRNNHQKREREQLITDASKVAPWIKFVALYFRHDRNNYDNIRQITRQRVLSRGDNHQTIHADTKRPEDIIEIMEGFMYRFEPLDTEKTPDARFDLVIDLDPLASTEDSVLLVIKRLIEKYPKLFPSGKAPTQAEVQNAISAAKQEYTVDIKHVIADKRSNKNAPVVARSVNTKQDKRIEYFGVTIPTPDVLALLERLFDGAPPERAAFYNTLKAQGRIQDEFHVTIIHKASAQKYPERWEALKKMYDQALAKTGSAFLSPEADLADVGVFLIKLVWDSRIMGFTALLVPNNPMELSQIVLSVNRHPHVTVGTANASIKPVETNDMLERWERAGLAKEGFFDIDTGSAYVKGKLRAVLSRQSGVNGRA